MDILKINKYYGKYYLKCMLEWLFEKLFMVVGYTTQIAYATFIGNVITKLMK